MLSTTHRRLTALAAILAAFATDQAAARADYATTVLANSPVGYWRLGDAPGSTTALDSSTTANDGAYFGSPVLGVAGLIDDPNTAVDFGGVSGVTIAHSSLYDFVDQPFTIEAWVKFDGPTPFNSRIFDNVGAGTPDGYGLGINDSSMILFGSVNASVNFSFLDSRAHYIVFTSDGLGTANGYVDGILVGSAAYSSSFPFSGPVHIGADSNGVNRFNGIIDEVALYGSALSGDQIQAHYRAGVVPEPSSIVLGAIGLGWLGSRTRRRR
ncbi:LamG domain-containing protein [Paludisphaera mucosa]|uniref:LamG domain-containing protein n=1 Tax=Paludisphaera mucosa TaxID=3030827 RepID=A0ABT6F407_9BACT|nr:LamG domain-containing protein [Paludisphaera mucosa]MDG3002237.1 LamG domain-containing protein [Paludisphaera mucosa]